MIFSPALIAYGLLTRLIEPLAPRLLDAAQAVQLATGPAAVIEPLGSVLPGSRIALDGRASAAIPGSQIVAYRWAQLAGPAVALADASPA